MKKYFILLFAFAFLTPLFAQQMNYTSGLRAASGDLWTNDGLTFIDTTSSTNNYVIVDLSDYFWTADINPLFSDDSVVNINSDRFYVGTLYVLFDNQGVEAPTTDSLLYTISVAPGVYTTETRAVAGAKFGTAVTLETIETINDYLSINNVYLHASKYKFFPPEVIRFNIAPTGDKDCDDSTKVNWRFAYPQIYKSAAEKLSTED